MTESDYLVGRTLLAMPGMGDPRFQHAVIALAVHDADGALGIGLGHLHSGLRFRTLLENVGIEPADAPDAPVHNGGPVEPERGFLIHSPEWEMPDSVISEAGFGLTASLDALRAIAEGHGPAKWMFALGYAGWGAGQLDAEMRLHGWHAAISRGKVLFDTPAAVRWTAAWKAEGIDPAHLAGTTGQA